MQRSTAQVLEDHLRLRQAAQLDMDLEQNYASDVILLCDHGAFKGRDAVRKSGDDLTAQLPDGRFEYGNQICHWRLRLHTVDRRFRDQPN